MRYNKWVCRKIYMTNPELRYNIQLLCWLRYLRVNKSFCKIKIKYICTFHPHTKLYGAISCIEVSYPKLHT